MYVFSTVTEVKFTLTAHIYIALLALAKSYYNHCAPTIYKIFQ